ncbi:MAG: DUF2062 domain-containing protein [Labilithrix sp.]|nr:DUF2062 domain-containing protein [Labilithrix sp.]
MLRRLWEKIKTLWKLAKSERASPREIGWAVAIGAFAGCTPAMGVHGPLAIGLATLFKKNRLFAWLGSRISNMVFLPFIVLAEVQVSHRLRTGEWLVLERYEVIDQAGTLLLDWCIGTIPVGVAIGGVMGVLSWAFALRRDRRRAARAATRPRDEPRPPAPGRRRPPRPPARHAGQTATATCRRPPARAAYVSATRPPARSRTRPARRRRSARGRDRRARGP